MYKSYTISSRESTPAIFRALFLAIRILVRRFAFASVRALRSVRHWLFTPRNYYEYDGDPIRATGWQMLMYNIIGAVVIVALSIRW